MDISQLLAGNGTASSPSPGKSGSTQGSNGAEFAQALKQAGNAAAKPATADSDLASTARVVPGSTQPGQATRPRLDDASSDERPEEAALLDELASEPQPTIALGVPQPLSQVTVQPNLLARQIGIALDGSGEAGQAEDALASGLHLGLGETGPATSFMQELDGIRQRMDMIAHAQRGEAAPPAQQALLNFQAAEATLAPRQQATETVSPLQATGTASPASDGLRHQQLAAQGMQALAQQQQAGSSQAAVQSTGFMEAVAAVNVDESASFMRQGDASSQAGALSLSAANVTGGGTHGAGATAQAMGTATPTLSAPLASPQWQQGLGQQLVALHQRGGQQVELHLHPAELGPLSISLKVDDQLAQAQFFSANPHVRAAVEQAIPQLRDALQQSGIQLGEAMVGEHQQRGDADSGQRNQGGTLAGRTTQGTVSALDTDMPSHAAHVVTRTELGGIDLYA